MFPDLARSGLISLQGSTCTASSACAGGACPTTYSVSTSSPRHLATPCLPYQTASVSFTIAATDSSTFTVSTQSNVQYTSSSTLQFVSGSTSSAVNCFENSAGSASFDQDVWVTVTCKNSVFSCPIQANFAFSCVTQCSTSSYVAALPASGGTISCGACAFLFHLLPP